MKTIFENFNMSMKKKKGNNYLAACSRLYQVEPKLSQLAKVSSSDNL